MHEELLQIKADLMQVDDAPLVEKTNLPTPLLPLKKKKRKRRGTENEPP
jgi:hypothetical protein